MSSVRGRVARAKRPFGREQLKAWRGVSDGSPQAELDFKFYRQATNKIGGISEAVEKCLRDFFNASLLAIAVSVATNSRSQLYFIADK